MAGHAAKGEPRMFAIKQLDSDRQAADVPRKKSNESAG